MQGQSVLEKQERTQRDYKEAQRKYNIQGKTTVLVWLRKHGSLEWQTYNPMKGKVSPQKQIKELEKKLKRAQMQNEILNKAVEIADEQLGTDIRKKYLDLLSKTSGQQEDEVSQLD
jgi:transposase-like protein